MDESLHQRIDHETGLGFEDFDLYYTYLTMQEEFAELIERHWDGIAAFIQLEDKVSLGFVEGLNNKIRVIQRRAYGLWDEEYLRLKVLTCMLPAI